MVSRKNRPGRRESEAGGREGGWGASGRPFVCPSSTFAPPRTPPKLLVARTVNGVSELLPFIHSFFQELFYRWLLCSSRWGGRWGCGEE